MLGNTAAAAGFVFLFFFDASRLFGACFIMPLPALSLPPRAPSLNPHAGCFQALLDQRG